MPAWSLWRAVAGNAESKSGLSPYVCRLVLHVSQFRLARSQIGEAARWRGAEAGLYLQSGTLEASEQATVGPREYVMKQLGASRQGYES